MFSNAKTVMINNKEVQSIITSNGGVLYERTPPISLILTSNKSVIQSGETATLTATLTDDGTPLSGKLIIFDGIRDNSITTDNTDTSYTLTGDYKLTIPTHQNHVDFCVLGTSDKVVTFGYSSGDQSRYMDIYDGDTIFISGDSVYVVDDAIYYIDENGDAAVLDVSDYDTQEISTPFYVGGVVIDDGIPSATTNSSGVATVSYVGKATGVLSIRAVYDSIQSDTYNLIDAVFYDEAKTSLSNEWSLTNITHSSNGTYTELAKTNSSNRGDCVLDCSLSSEFAIEWDNYGSEDTANTLAVYSTNGNSYFSFSQKNIIENTHVKVIVTSSQLRIFVGGVEKTPITANYNLTDGVDLRLRMNTGSTSPIKFSNFKAYLL